jgi:hypothetical protein
MAFVIYNADGIRLSCLAEHIFHGVFPLSRAGEGTGNRGYLRHMA